MSDLLKPFPLFLQPLAQQLRLPGNQVQPLLLKDNLTLKEKDTIELVSYVLFVDVHEVNHWDHYMYYQNNYNHISGKNQICYYSHYEN